MDITNYLSGITANISTETQPKSIPATVVGQAFIDLANLTKSNVDGLNTFVTGHTGAINTLSGVTSGNSLSITNLQTGLTITQTIVSANTASINSLSGVTSGFDSALAGFETPVWLKKPYISLSSGSTAYANSLNGILDIWTEFPNGKPSFWDSTSWDLLVTYVATDPGSKQFFIILADQSGLTVEGTNIFTWFMSVPNATDQLELTVAKTIESKTVNMRCIVDWSKVKGNVTTGVVFNLGVAVANRSLKVQKKTASIFATADLASAKNLTDVSSRAYYKGNKLVIASEISSLKILSGTDITGGVAPLWTTWGYYTPPSGGLFLTDSTYGWYYNTDYLKIYPNAPLTVNTKVNDSAVIVLYDANHNVTRTLGTGTGSATQSGVTFTTASNEVYLRCNNRSTLTFSIVINADYDVLNQRITSLETAVSALQLSNPTKSAIGNIVYPTRIYNTCNDVNITSGWNQNLRGYSVDVYLDRFVTLTYKRDAFWKEAKRTWKNLSSRIYYNPEPTSGSPRVQYNNEVDIYEEPITLTITGADVIETGVTFTHTSSKSSLSKAKFPKILQIGDSVTESGNASINGTPNNPNVSWAWVKYFFELDRIESGNAITDYNCLMIGTRSKQVYNATFNGTTNSIQAYCEGRSGWKTSDYLTLANIGSVTNNFYDSTQTVNFSLATYLSKYKTLNDDGKTRLITGSTAGTSVTDVNAADVCTPNICIIQLGFNDNQANYVADLTTMINKIKAEYPNMIIGLSQIDSAGTYWSEKFPEWEGATADLDMLNQIYVKRIHEKMVAVFNAVKALESDSNRVYIIPSAFIEPTAMSMPYRRQDGAGALSNSNNFFERFQPFSTSSAIGYHPNNICNAAWGYEVYSWVKWLCAKNYI